MALLAATTLGVEAADTVTAVVRSEVPLRGGRTYRLVVQSYDAMDGELPDGHAKPVGSLQRPVTADELRDGVRVELLELRSGSSARKARGQSPVVVAWLEASAAELEFDGRRARPAPSSLCGVANRPRVSGQPVLVALHAPQSMVAAA